MCGLFCQENSSGGVEGQTPGLGCGNCLMGKPTEMQLGARSTPKLWTEVVQVLKQALPAGDQAAAVEGGKAKVSPGWGPKSLENQPTTKSGGG